MRAAARTRPTSLSLTSPGGGRRRGASSGRRSPTGAEDSSIDLIGMDIIWTGEFANAGWIAPVPDDVKSAVSENVFDSVLRTSEFEGRMYNVPIWSNTQLLWYRKDKVDQAPETWDEMIDTAVEQKTKIQVQANRYEGL